MSLGSSGPGLICPDFQWFKTCFKRPSLASCSSARAHMWPVKLLQWQPKPFLQLLWAAAWWAGRCISLGMHVKFSLSWAQYGGMRQRGGGERWRARCQGNCKRQEHFPRAYFPPLLITIIPVIYTASLTFHCLWYQPRIHLFSCAPALRPPVLRVKYLESCYVIAESCSGLFARDQRGSP